MSPRRLLFILAVILIVSGCSDQEVVQNEEGIFVLGSVERMDSTERGITPGSRRIEINTFSGDIHIRRSSDETASFRFTKRARASSAENALKLLSRISIEETGDAAVYSIVIDSPEKSRSAVDIEAYLPSATPVTIDLTSGDVIIESIDGPIDVAGTAGSIEYSGNSRSVRLETRNGDIAGALETVGSESNLTLETSNGDIRIVLPQEAGTSVDATTSAGDIRTSGITFDRQSLATNGAGARLTGTAGTGSGSITARTFHGDIMFAPFLPGVDTIPETPSDVEAAPEQMPLPDQPADSSNAAQAPGSAGPIEEPAERL